MGLFGRRDELRSTWTAESEASASQVDTLLENLEERVVSRERDPRSLEQEHVRVLEQIQEPRDAGFDDTLRLAEAPDVQVNAWIKRLEEPGYGTAGPEEPRYSIKVVTVTRYGIEVLLGLDEPKSGFC